MVFLGGMGSQGKMGNKDLLAPLAHAVGEPSTPGGGRVLAHKWKALS